MGLERDGDGYVEWPLDLILDKVVTVPTRRGELLEMTLGELAWLLINKGDLVKLGILYTHAKELLNENGLGLSDDRKCLMVANVNEQIAKTLENTKWHRSWGEANRKMPGAMVNISPQTFGSTRSRAVSIPIISLMD